MGTKGGLNPILLSSDHTLQTQSHSSPLSLEFFFFKNVSPNFESAVQFRGHNHDLMNTSNDLMRWIFSFVSLSFLFYFQCS